MTQGVQFEEGSNGYRRERESRVDLVKGYLVAEGPQTGVDTIRPAVRMRRSKKGNEPLATQHKVEVPKRVLQEQRLGWA